MTLKPDTIDPEDGIRWPWDYVEPTDRGLQTLVEQRAASEDPDHIEGTTLFVASTDSEDRAMDVVEQNWKLKSFRDNPVILDNHNYSRVVGRGMTATVPRSGPDAGKLMIRVEWDTDNPDTSIRSVGHQHLKGFRKAGSVGFRAAKKTLRSKLPADHAFYQAPIKVETAWGEYEYSGTLYSGPELYEFSSATVPMNADALQRSFRLHVLRAEGDPAPAEGDPEPAPTDVLEWLKDAARRGQAVDLLWPDLLVRARSLLDAEEEEPAADADPAADPPPADETLPAKAFRLWIPRFLDVLRSDRARRIVKAYATVGPPASPTPTTPVPGVFARALSKLEIP